MEKKYSRAHIGESFPTNEGYIAKVVDGSSKNNYCTVQIEEWVAEVQYSSVKNGGIKYPHHKSVQGVGYYGEGSYKSRINGKKTRAYKTWRGMLERCYSDECQTRQPTYKDVAVAKDWHNFQNFAKWFDENYIDGWHLDKDLLSGDIKIYSSETCIFIPQALNSFMTNIKNNNTSGFVGVNWHKHSKKWVARIHIDGKSKHLGFYIDKQNAAKVYQTARAQQVNKLKEKYKDVLPAHILDKIK